MKDEASSMTHLHYSSLVTMCCPSIQSFVFVIFSENQYHTLVCRMFIPFDEMFECLAAVAHPQKTIETRKAVNERFLLPFLRNSEESLKKIKDSILNKHHARRIID